MKPATRSASRFDRHDGLLLVGLGLCAVGAGLAWVPAGFLVGGLGCIAWAVLSDLAARSRQTKEG